MAHLLCSATEQYKTITPYFVKYFHHLQSPSTSHHTQNGLVVCGGYEILRHCEVFRNGDWILYENILQYTRNQHNSWTLPDGNILLMHGADWSGKLLVFDPDAGTSQVTSTVTYLRR